MRGKLKWYLILRRGKAGILLFIFLSAPVSFHALPSLNLTLTTWNVLGLTGGNDHIEIL